jgi:hypothetical protein
MNASMNLIATDVTALDSLVDLPLQLVRSTCIAAQHAAVQTHRGLRPEDGGGGGAAEQHHAWLPTVRRTV